VFGWVFASHQIGASAMAFGAGVVRDHTDSYNPAFYAGAVLCVIAALLSISIRRREPEPQTPRSDEDAALAPVG
jgi:predicted MFS family arabinose efflux permease